MSLYGASLLVSAALLQGALSQTEINMHGESVRHKIATEKGGYCPSVHTALCRGPMPSGNGQNGMMRALWEVGCKENSDYHLVVGDGASNQVCGPVCLSFSLQFSSVHSHF